MLSYSWPGNVRQLENSIHSAVIMSDGPLITDQDIANVLSIRLSDLSSGSSQPKLKSSDFQGDSRKQVSTQGAAELEIQPLAYTEEVAIKKALDHCDGNVVRAAGLLQVSPSTLYRKIQSWD